MPAEDSTELVRLPNDNCEAYCSTTLWVGTSDIPTFAVSILLISSKTVSKMPAVH